MKNIFAIRTNHLRRLLLLLWPRVVIINAIKLLGLEGLRVLEAIIIGEGEDVIVIKVQPKRGGNLLSSLRLKASLRALPCKTQKGATCLMVNLRQDDIRGLQK
ncbi:hypothetical protein [Acetomicrobium mobile]|uniref:hypothetical protein n=1 Tax=Acetomicrobium mobile TaxID=97477 RepID=UPI0026EF6296|nr:hypothetical protein [Acetomicrobium mobile]